MITETKAIRQSEFAELHNLRPVDVAALRTQHLTEGVDWWSVGRAIWWTEEAADSIGEILAEGKPPTSNHNEQDQKGHTGFQVQPETPLPLPEVPTGEAAQQDSGDTGGDAEIATPAEAQAEATLTARVTRPCINKRMAYADLNGVKIAVNIGRNRDKMLKKLIKVRKDAEGDTYTYIP